MRVDGILCVYIRLQRQSIAIAFVTYATYEHRYMARSEARREQAADRLPPVAPRPSQLVAQLLLGPRRRAPRVPAANSATASSSSSAKPRTSRQQTLNVCTSPCWPATAGGTAAS